jgi:hypothetical protein
VHNLKVLEPVEICYNLSGHLASYTYIVICPAYLKRMWQRKISEKCLLTVNRGMDFIWAARPCIECCTIKEISGITCLLAGVSKVKGIRKG